MIDSLYIADDYKLALYFLSFCPSFCGWYKLMGYWDSNSPTCPRIYIFHRHIHASTHGVTWLNLTYKKRPKKKRRQAKRWGRRRVAWEIQSPGVALYIHIFSKYIYIYINGDIIWMLYVPFASLSLSLYKYISLLLDPKVQSFRGQNVFFWRGA